MEQILINLNDPSWWFTGLFFVIIGIIFSKISKISEIISKILPAVGKHISDIDKLKINKRVKRYRQHQISVNFMVARYWSLVSVMTIYSILVVIFYLFYPDSHEYKDKKYFLLILVVSIYCFQLIVIWERKFLKILMKAHIDWKKIRKLSDSE